MRYDANHNPRTRSHVLAAGVIRRKGAKRVGVQK